MISLRISFATVVLALAACSGGETTPTETETTTTQPETPPDKELDLTIDELKGDSENIALVPSPVETQKALEAAGIDTRLADLIVKRPYDPDEKDADDVAVRTGVVIANMLLTVKTASDAQLIENLDHIQQGLTRLNGGADIDATISEIKERINAKAVTRDELLKELDELSGALIPELEFNGVDRVVPLIQAGSWLQGSNLVARAVKAQGNAAAADNLLKQPAVVDYFIKYVKTEGKERTTAAVTEKLDSSLQTLKGLAGKADSLTNEDIDTVIQVTDEVLSLL